MALDKQGNFSQQPSELPDVPSPSMTPDQIRAKWQTPLDELKTTVNNAFDKLNSTTDGASGADNIGATGFDGTASTPQAMLEDLNTRKAEKGADWTGTWQGFNPSQVDQTIRDQVNTNTSQLADTVYYFKSNKYGAKGDGSTSDSSALVTLFNDLSANGSGRVELTAGTYIIDTMPNLPLIKNVQFVAKGNVELKFTFNGTYQATNKIFSQMENVSFWGITFSAPNANLFSVFGDNTNLKKISFINCKIKDCTPNFLLGANNNVLFMDCEWTQSDTPPTNMQGTIGGVQTGQFVVRNCSFNFVFNGASGTLVVVATNAPVLEGLHVSIIDSNFMTDNKTGFTVDAAIDSEPSGTVQIESLTIRNCKIWNARTYLTGAKFIDVDGVSYRWTSVGQTQSDACQLDVFNSSATQPKTGTLRLRGINLIQDDDSSATYNPVPLKIQRDVERLIVDDSYLSINNLGSYKSYELEVAGGSIDRLIIKDTEFNSNADVGVSAFMFDVSTINHIKFIRSKVNKQWQHLFAFTSGTVGTIETFEMEGNDFSELSLSTGSNAIAWLYNPNTTFTHARFKDNINLNPVAGVVTTPPIPTSGTSYTNNTGYPVNISITGGTVSQIAINGQNSNLTNGAFFLPPDSQITLTYSVAPSWVWMGL